MNVSFIVLGPRLDPKGSR